MSADELRRKFPNAPESFIQRNADRVPANDPQPAQGRPLVGVHPRKAKSRMGAVERAQITLRVFARRPADWDAWHFKELIDCLVKAGILDDDRWDLLQGKIVSEKVFEKAEERTVITIDYPVNNV